MASTCQYNFGKSNSPGRYRKSPIPCTKVVAYWEDKMTIWIEAGKSKPLFTPLFKIKIAQHNKLYFWYIYLTLNWFIQFVRIKNHISCLIIPYNPVMMSMHRDHIMCLHFIIKLLQNSDMINRIKKSYVEQTKI